MSNKQDHRKFVHDWFWFEGYSFSRKQLLQLQDGHVIQCGQIKIECIDRFIIFTINNKQALYNQHQRDGSIYQDELKEKDREQERKEIMRFKEVANDTEPLEVMEDEYSYRDACLIKSNWKKWK